MRPFFHSSPTTLRHRGEARSPIPAPCRSSDVQAEGSAVGELVHLEPMGYAGLPWPAAASSPTSFLWGASDPSTNVKVQILSVTVIWQQVFSLQKKISSPQNKATSEVQMEVLQAELSPGFQGAATHHPQNVFLSDRENISVIPSRLEIAP